MIAQLKIPSPAAELYAVALALDCAKAGTHDIGDLIEQGRTFALSIGAGTIPPGRASVYAFDAGATFMRAWAKHDPELYDALILNAQVLEAARDVAMLSVPRTDA